MSNLKEINEYSLKFIAIAGVDGADFLPALII